MIRFEIDQDSLKRLREKLTRLQDKNLIHAALIVGGNTLKRIMAEYPPASHRPQPFKTDKQRRYFFWALGKGKIEVPYRRGQSPGSEDMKHRWIVRPVSNGVEVANNASYVKYVHSWEMQATYHKITGWRTDRQVIADDRGTIIEDVSDAYAVALRHVWGE